MGFILRLISFLTCCCLLSCAGLQAQKVPSRFYLLEDSTSALTSPDALELYRNGKFTATDKEELNPGFTRSVFWLALDNPTDLKDDSLLLYIGDHHINRIYFYFAADTIIRQQYTTGDYFPFAQRPVESKSFYFPVNKKGTYLVRIDKANESLQLSFWLISAAEAAHKEQRNALIMSLFTGMMLLMMVFGAYLFFISRDAVYFYYLAYLGTGWLWVLANSGYGFQYLWPDLPWFASKARPIFAIASGALSMQFMIRFVGVEKKNRLHYFVNTVNIMMLFYVVIILCFNDKGYQSRWWMYIQYLIPVTTLVYVVAALFFLIKKALGGNRLALFYLAGATVLIATAIIQASVQLGGISRFQYFFSNFGLGLGYLAESIILTAGLAYRFNQYRLEKEKLLIEMNKQQLKSTQVLMDVQEAERNQVANQLHDVAGSLLSAAKLNLSSLRENGRLVDEKAMSQLLKTEEAVGLVSDMVRNLSHALSPVMLEQVGFKTTIEKVINIFNASGKISFKQVIIGFDQYEPALNNYYTVLYGIIYELLNNSAKHSGAKNVLLQVTEHEDAFTMILEDDGCGFNNKRQMNKESLGIEGIRSKVNYYKGSFAIDNNEPGGILVTIEIPKPIYDK